MFIRSDKISRLKERSKLKLERIKQILLLKLWLKENKKNKLIKTLKLCRQKHNCKIRYKKKTATANQKNLRFNRKSAFSNYKSKNTMLQILIFPLWLKKLSITIFLVKGCMLWSNLLESHNSRLEHLMHLPWYHRLDSYMQKMPKLSFKNPKNLFPRSILRTLHIFWLTMRC